MELLVDEQLAHFNITVERELCRIGRSFSSDFFSEAADMLLQAEKAGKRIHITGVGKPHHIASYMASLFSSVGTPCYLLDGTEATHGSSGQVRSGDVVICISYYGNVQELMLTMKTLKQNDAKLIAVTGFDDSWIARYADVHLNCFVEEEGDYLNKPPRTSMLAALYLLMNLSLVLQTVKAITPEDYQRHHPSGQLGKL